MAQAFLSDARALRSSMGSSRTGSSSGPQPLRPSPSLRNNSACCRCSSGFESSGADQVPHGLWSMKSGNNGNGASSWHSSSDVATMSPPSPAARLPSSLPSSLPQSSFRTFDDEEIAAHVAAKTRVKPSKPLKYGTIMLKVSGEALQGSLGFGVDATVMRSVAEEVKGLVQAGVKVAIVVGGGNYFRGANAWQGLDRATADYVGMMATVMNALQLQGALEGLGVDTRVQTAIEMREIAEPYIRRRAVAHLNAGRVVIFGAGTGNPFFTTDTAAALRAAEINAEVFIKATKVDGIYDSDPLKNPEAKKYDKLSYRQCTDESLRIMDETAITLCKENNIPVLVLNMLDKGNILKAALGEAVGTVVCEGCEF